MEVVLIGADRCSQPGLVNEFQAQAAISTTVLGGEDDAGFTAALHRATVQGIVIAGPWRLRAQRAVAALAAGKAVLLDGPFGLSLAEAQIVEAAARGKTAWMIPHPLARHAGTEVKSLLKQYFCGELRQIFIEQVDDQDRDYSRPAEWRHVRAETGCCSPLTLGLISCLIDWVGEPADVKATVKTFETQRPIDRTHEVVQVTTPDSIHALLSWASGTQGVLVVTSLVCGETRKLIEISGDRGTIRIDLDDPDHVLIARSDDPALRPIPIPPEHQAPSHAASEFIAAIGGTPPTRLTPLQQGVAVVRLCEAIQR